MTAPRDPIGAPARPGTNAGQDWYDDGAVYAIHANCPPAACECGLLEAVRLDVGLLTTALHTADPVIGSDGIGHTPMCEERAERIAAAYEREWLARHGRSSDPTEADDE